ncbi:MAG: hypothetical protein NVS9B15_19710 [Acidobacteriaceae bacterium]
MKRAAIIVLALLALVAIGGYALLQIYPKPQIASAAGKPAPDFTLQTSEDKPFTLTQQRGKTVVMLFYRGYW